MNIMSISHIRIMGMLHNEKWNITDSHTFRFISLGLKSKFFFIQLTVSMELSILTQQKNEKWNITYSHTFRFISLELKSKFFFFFKNAFYYNSFDFLKMKGIYFPYIYE